MRFSTTVALAAAAAPVAVSAQGKLGYALGVRKPDTKGTCKTYADFQQDFAALLDTSIKPTPYKPTIVRTYAAIDGGANSIGGDVCYGTGDLLKAAEEADIQVLLGLWADDLGAFEKEVEESLKYAKKYEKTIYAYTVGSEGLYREQQKEGTGYKADYLYERISEFKEALKKAGVTGKKVGTADSWNKFQDGTADSLIKKGVDLFLVNAFGYWQSQKITNATATYIDDLQQAFGHIQKTAGSPDAVELWNGETGWPTDGGSDYHDDKYGKDSTAVASTVNAQTFFTEGVCAALKWNINVFYFEAFAEPWKPVTKGANKGDGDETHWGAFSADRKLLIKDLSCAYPAKSEL